MEDAATSNADQSASGQPTKCLVIGGCGFVGRHLVEKLLELGHEVSVVDLRVTFEDARVTFFQTDLCNVEDLKISMEGVHTVFHCATPNPLSRDRKLFHRVNVEGTGHVIDTCHLMKVKNLILVSSAFVVFNGDSIEDGTEDLPYSSQKLSHYVDSKASQEQLVLKADGARLNTVALRPSGIFGPRDPNFLPNVARTAAGGQGKFIIGDGSNTMDFVYVENVVHALVLAADSLGPDSKIKGKAYNITNKEPVLFWKFVERMSLGLGHPAPKYHISKRLVYFLAVLGEFLADLVSPAVEVSTTLNSFVVRTASTNLRFNSDRAGRDFRYEPKVKLEDGIKMTIDAVPLELLSGTSAKNEKTD